MADNYKTPFGGTVFRIQWQLEKRSAVDWILIVKEHKWFMKWKL